VYDAPMRWWISTGDDPGFSAIAPRKVASSRSNARSSTARKSASLVPNMRTTYGWLTFAARATASVVVPT
jgi:hypothetical protein